MLRHVTSQLRRGRRAAGCPNRDRMKTSAFLRTLAVPERVENADVACATADELATIAACEPSGDGPELCVAAGAAEYLKAVLTRHPNVQRVVAAVSITLREMFGTSPDDDEAIGTAFVAAGVHVALVAAVRALADDFGVSGACGYAISALTDIHGSSAANATACVDSGAGAVIASAIERQREFTTRAEAAARLFAE